MLQRLQNVHSNLPSLGFVHSNLFAQFFAVWTSTSALPSTLIVARPTNTPTRWAAAGCPTATLPDAMLNSERCFNGHTRY